MKMTSYRENIVKAFKDLCAEQGGGAAPFEVTNLLAERGQLSELDTVIDIEKLMRELRNMGYL